MTASYTWVQWNRHKINYDLTLGAGSLLFLGVFVGLGAAAYSGERALDPMILMMRAFSTLSLVLLHIILCIGPLARLSTLFSPLLYNRRHLGVSMFFAALAHSGLAVLYYGAFGVRFPVNALVDGYHAYASVSGFPFEVLGLGALLVLFTMASTSHDFWLSFLGHRTWKSLHMLVYVAYALVLLHVALGILQSETIPVYAGLIIGGLVVVTGLHLVAGLRERGRDAHGAAPQDGWVDIGAVNAFELNKGRVVCLKDAERVAVFRHDDGLSAMANVCAHQGGPLGEGEVIGGCVTCPWHGYQYLPANGQSPPPFHEKVPTYELRVEGDRVLLNTAAKDPGTPIEPAPFPSSAAPESQHG